MKLHQYRYTPIKRAFHLKKLTVICNRYALMMFLAFGISAQCYAQEPDQRGAKVKSMDFERKPYAASQLEWKPGTEHQRAMFDLAFNLQEHHHLAEAQKKYRELSSSFENFALFFNLGICEADAGELAAAEVDLIQSAKLNPGHRDTYKMLASVQEALGKPKEARVSHDRFLKL
jgi:hypothetical protein